MMPDKALGNTQMGYQPKSYFAVYSRYGIGVYNNCGSLMNAATYIPDFRCEKFGNYYHARLMSLQAFLSYAENAVYVADIPTYFSLDYFNRREKFQSLNEARRERQKSIQQTPLLQIYTKTKPGEAGCDEEPEKAMEV
jgi:hypothetical protein